MKTKMLLTVALLFSSPAMAWGGLGHRTTGLIAQQNLLPVAAAEVAKLLGKETLADVASWADFVRANGTYQQTVWYHFEKIADGLGFLDNLKTLPEWQQRKGGTVGTILMANAILRDSGASAASRTDALKFLVHYVGDIHQPLHTGRPVDNGAVKIIIDWFGEKMSLHHVWDTAMIFTGHSDIITTSMTEVEASAAYASFLNGTCAQQTIDGSMSVEGWLNESLALRTAAYDPSYQTNQSKYQIQHLPEVDRRIYASGIRLASLLNAIFTNEPVPVSQVELWGKMEAIVGDLKQIISFNP